MTHHELPEPPELPRATALAWGVAANPMRGPKREMSVERIVDAAVEIADAGGLAAVSMSAVASSLGFTPMSLYRYVTAKDDLLTLMQETGIGIPSETVREATSSGWRDAIEVWSREMSEVYLRHPWLLDISIEGTPTTPNNLAWLEAALEILAPLALTGEQKVAVVLALIAQARWEGHIVRGYVEAAAAAGATPDDLDLRGVAILEALVTPAEFPRVHDALISGVFSPDGADPFAFGRDRVLDGVEALLDGRAVVRDETPPPDPLDEQVARDPKVKEAAKARREVEKQLRELRKREREAQQRARERLGRG